MARDKKVLVRVGYVLLCGLLTLLIVTSLPEAAVEQDDSLVGGVAVESVTEGSALAQAGLREGDVLLRWKGTSAISDAHSAPENPMTIFDWYLFLLDQAPRGPLSLTVRRVGQVTTWEGVSLERLSAENFWLGGFAPVMTEATRRRVEKSHDLRAAGDLPAAATVLWKAERPDRAETWNVECWLHLRRASIWFAAGDPEKAREALALAQTVAKVPAARLAVFRFTAKLDQAARDLAASESALLEALELQRTTWGEGLHLASTLGRIGVLSWFQGRLDRAEDFLRRAADVAERYAPESGVHAAMVGNLGLILEAQGDLSAAEVHQARAVAIQRSKTPDHRNVAGGLINLGSIDLRRGNLAQAADRFRAALEMIRRLPPDKALEASCLGNLGSVELERGDLEMAAEYARESFELWRAIDPRSRDAAISLSRLGQVYQERGETDRAEAAYGEALRIHRALSPTGHGVAEVLEGLGSLARDRGDLATAQSFFERALEIWRQVGPNSPAVAVSLNRLGYLAYEQDLPAAAGSYYRRALEIFDGLQIQNVNSAEAHLGLGLLARDEGDLEAALHYWSRSMDILQAQLQNLGGPAYLKATYQHEHDWAYRIYVELLVDTGQTEAAVEALERSRAMQFLALLRQRDLDFRADISSSLQATRSRLATTYDKVQRELALLDPAGEPEGSRSLRSQLWKVWRELESISEEIRKQSPAFSSLQYPQPLSLSAFQKALDPGTVALSYSVGEERTDLFVMTREKGLHVKTLPIGEKDLRHRVTEFRSLLHRALPGERTGARQSLDSLGGALYRLLLAPVDEMIGPEQRILILPDGPLHRLPWTALIRGSGEYVVEWKPVHIALSATVYAELKQDRPRRDSDQDRLELVAFGDPSFPDGIEKVRTEAIADVQVRSALDRGLFDWKSLRHSRVEVDSIASLYPASAVRTFLGSEATEEAVKSVALEAQESGTAPRIVHFATHGHLDDRFPLNSAVVLSPPDEFEEGRENGLLQVWEIFERIRLDADLVVLSACSSALGEELGGEGLVGLTRAFQYAGARSVVASLWNIRDEATSELMIRFYRHLRGGLSTDQALRAARLELIREPIRGKDFSAPLYWAAFQVHGDWR